MTNTLAQNFVVHNDTVSTGPLQKVRKNVLLNDTVPCTDYILTITSVLNSTTEGVATVFPGGFIEFSPAFAFRNDTVRINYSVECESVQKFAILVIAVTEYNRPANVIDPNTPCITVMSQVNFGIKPKFQTASTTGDCVDGFSVPLVGDLNGDGKPEIVAMGVTQGFGGGALTTTRYINIYNGQTGARMFQFDLGTGTVENMGYAYHRAPAQFALADVDNDGVCEIIVALTNFNGIVRCYKPIFSGTTITSLNMMWQAPVLYAAPNNASRTSFGYPHPYIADINADGFPEVIIYNKIYNGVTGALLMSWRNAAPAPSFKYSSILTGQNGLSNPSSTTPTAQTQANGALNSAMTGRRLGSGTYADEFLNVLAIIDIDGCGQQEIITGNRIHKFTFNSLSDHTQNTYTTIEGPVSVDINENPTTGAKRTHYLSDGLTRVADIDGDGHLDIVVTQVCDNGSQATKLIIFVWDPRFPSVVKAAITYYSGGVHGNHGIHFIGDINGKPDGWDGTGYNLKLPEICLITAGTMINRVAGANTAAGRSGVFFHPCSDDSLRWGANNLGNTVPTADWNNNNTTNNFRRFNRPMVDAANAFCGHVVAFTYDAQATEVEERLKISWAIEHSDRSHNTGMTLFDFDNNGTMDICYRDEATLRVISPALGGPTGNGKDYVRLWEDISAPTTSIMFRTPCFSGTAFEYPVIADVNMDASADIVVMQSANSQLIAAAAGFIKVFEYSGAKWSPCPPVWNQSMYDPTQVREDMKINSRPIPMLTPFNLNGKTIYPFNGSWVQQPIVRDGKDYDPVVRMPDAIFENMVVKVISTSSSNITMTITNAGSATLAAGTPIAFYNGGTAGNPLASSTFISTVPLDLDVFPGETVTQTNSISGNYNNCLIWARIMDDNGVSFPPQGYDDCDYSNNVMSGIDCPYLLVKISGDPSATICGVGGWIKLRITHTNGSPPPYGAGKTQTYQWYKDNVPISTDSAIFVNAAGSYKCFVTDDLCRVMTDPVNVVISETCYRFTVNDVDYVLMRGERYCDVRDFKFEVFPKNAGLSTVIWRVDGVQLTAYNNAHIAYANNLLDGLHTVQMTANGINYTTTFYVGGLPKIWSPENNISGSDADKQNWEIAINWDPVGVPTNCTNVFIPGTSTHYPRLTDSAICNNIYFIQGAELGRPDLLNYKRAYVHLNFDLKTTPTQVRTTARTNVLDFSDTKRRVDYSAGVSSPALSRERWYMLSSPLRGVVTGDLGFGGYPLTFLMKFGPVTKDGAHYPVGKWSTTYTNMAVSLTKTEGFAYFMYGWNMGPNNVGCAETGVYGSNSALQEMLYIPSTRLSANYGFRETNGIIELPFFEDLYPTGLNSHRTQVYDQANLKSTFYVIDNGIEVPTNFSRLNGDKDEVLRETNNGNFRFIPEEYISGKWNFPQIISHSGAGLGGDDDFMVGNPFMSSLNMLNFLNDNNSTIQDHYKIWDGSSYITHKKIGGTIVAPYNEPSQAVVDPVIAPLQGFFLTTLSAYSGAGDAAFFDVHTISTTRDPGKASNLRSDEQPENILRIKAENKYTSTYMLIGYLKNAADGYRENEDVRRLFAPYDNEYGHFGYVPEIYALADEVPVDVRLINDKRETKIPLGFRTTFTGEIKITITGMDKYPKATRIVFTDQLEGKTIDLTGLPTYTYTFNNTDLGIQNGRFSIGIENTYTSVPYTNDSGNLNIYSNSKGIYVVSSSTDPVKLLTVYDFQGKTVYESSSDLNYYPLPENLQNMPLIVKVITKNCLKSVKINAVK